MRLKSITAKHYLFGLLLLLVASSYALKGQLAHAENAAAKREQAEQLFRQAQATQGGLQHAVNGTPLMSLDRELAEALLMLERNRAANVIEFVNLGTTKLQAARDAQPIDGLTSPLGQTDGSVRSIELHLKGIYHDYDGLKRFLAALATRPIAVRSLKVTSNSFETDLLVLGV